MGEMMYASLKHVCADDSVESINVGLNWMTYQMVRYLFTAIDPRLHLNPLFACDRESRSSSIMPDPHQAQSLHTTRTMPLNFHRDDRSGRKNYRYRKNVGGVSMAFRRVQGEPYAFQQLR